MWVLTVDDATGGVVNALFCGQEDAHNYFMLMQGLLRRRGVPLALYADRHPVFKHRSEYQLAGTPTQFGRAMKELGIELIFALSPQAKGRVERTAGTFQDGWSPSSGWLGQPPWNKPEWCSGSSCRDSTGVSRCRPSVPSLLSSLCRRTFAWSKSCASSTAGG